MTFKKGEVVWRRHLKYITLCRLLEDSYPERIMIKVRIIDKKSPPWDYKETTIAPIRTIYKLNRRNTMMEF